MKQITISFKSNKEELELLEWLNNKSSKTAYIKDLLKIAKEKEESNKLKVVKGYMTFEE